MMENQSKKWKTSRLTEKQSSTWEQMEAHTVGGMFKNIYYPFKQLDHASLVPRLTRKNDAF